MSNQLTDYVLMPVRGLRFEGNSGGMLSAILAAAASAASNALDSVAPSVLGIPLSNILAPTSVTEMLTQWLKKFKKTSFKSLDAIAENGAKLVRMTEEAARALRQAEPGVRIAPVMYYRPAQNPVPRVAEKAKLASGTVAVTVKVKVVDSQTKSPIAGVRVIAFTNFIDRAGDEAVTNAKGEARLTDLRVGTKIERLYVQAPAFGYWGHFRKGLELKSEQEIGLRALDFSVLDGARHFYAGAGSAGDGEGVRVAVVDTGVAPDHSDLRVVGGACTVTGEAPEEWGPKGNPHGTHVAGIVASRGTSPNGMQGVAPMAELMSYRVFGASNPAANFAIAKAIDQAANAGCDLINLSLKYDGVPDGPLHVDEVIRQALEDARAKGSVVVAATGNDGRKRIAYPAADAAALAVAAIGRKGTYPANSIGRSEEMRPYGADPKNFVASFSNVGLDLDLVGPGVDIVSTVPGGYAPMSGTSMAAPAVTGLGARLLSRNPAIRDLPRDAARADAIIRLIMSSCKDMGFEASYQGSGIPL